MDCRRRSDRVAHRPKPVGGQRAGLQSGGAGRGQHLGGVDVSGVRGQRADPAAAVGIRGAGAGARPEPGGSGDADAGHRAAVRAQPGGPPRDHAAGRCTGLHRRAAGTRLRHLRPRKRFGDGLSRAALVDDGLLVAGQAGASAGAGVHRHAGFRGRLQRPGASRVGTDRRRGADHDADRRAGRTAAAGDRGGRRAVAGGLPNLPNGLLRLAVSRHRAGQGRRRRQVVAGPDLPVELQRPLRAVGAGVLLARSVWCCGRRRAGTEPERHGHNVIGWRSAGPHGAEPGRRRDLHPGQRAAAGAVLDPAGRRLHARPGAARSAAVPTRAGRGGAGGAFPTGRGSPARPATGWPAG